MGITAQLLVVNVPSGRVHIDFARDCAQAQISVGRAAAYVCRDFTCHAPVTDRAGLEKELA